MTKSARLACWLLLILGVFCVYVPGLHGSFVFDDVPNVGGNDAVQITDLSLRSLRRAAVSGIASEFGRPVSMLSFGINYALSGGDPFHFKLTNLLLHLVNVVLAGALTWVLVQNYPCFSGVRAQSGGIALATAAIWGLHPLQVSTTLYVVQRMVLLSAFFTLGALLLYAAGRIRQWRGQPGIAHILVALLVLGPLAFMSKETGILLAAYIVVLELFGPLPQAPPGARIPTGALVLVIGLATLVAALYLRVKIPELASSYYAKGFTATERVLTEPRALLWYLKMLIFPDIREMGLTHDDWQASRSLLAPLSTAPALIGVLLAIGALPWLRIVLPAAGLCLAWFLAGHSIEASPLPLDLVYEHRNYLPSLGICLGLSSAGACGFQRLSRFPLRLAVIAGIVIAVALAALTAMRVNEWRDPLNWGVAQTTHHPASAISFLELGAAYATLAEGVIDPAARQSHYENADAAFAEAFRLNPRIASGPISRVILAMHTSHAVPPARFDEIIQTVGTGAILSSSKLSLVRLLACASKDPRCTLSEVQFMAVVDAALRNPDCPPFFSSQLLALASEFYGERQHNVDTAILLAKAATEIPGAAEEAWLPLVRWLITGGYRAQAARTLDELDRIDKLDLLAERRQQFRRALQNGPAQPDHDQTSDRPLSAP